jgi:hypothetical protein
MALIAKETSTLKSWTHGLSMISFHGARAFAKASPTAAADCGLDSYALAQITEENDHLPWMIERVREKFSGDLKIQFNLRMNSMDALSQLGSLAFADERESEEWRAVSSEVWTSWAEHRGSIACVEGSIKSGKTALALLLSEHFMAKGRIVASNIMVNSPPPEYHYCAQLSDMLLTVCEARLQNREIVILMDEAGLFWARVETVRPRNIDMSKLLLCYGKMHACLIFISHFEEQLPGIIARNSVATFQKRGIKEAYVEIDQGIRIKPRLLTKVPMTTLQYDADQLQYYSLDMNINELFDFMSSLPQGKNQWELIRNYVLKHKGEVSEEGLDPKSIAKWLRTKGKSEREIAVLVGKSNSTIHEWLVSEQKA